MTVQQGQGRPGAPGAESRPPAYDAETARRLARGEQSIDRRGRVVNARQQPRAEARTRRARLTIARVDPWSVMKVSFLFSIALGIMIVVAVATVWSVLDSMGVFSTVGETLAQITGGEGFDLVSFFSFSRVVGAATLLALVDVVLVTALATLGAFLYNVIAAVVGGLEVTLTDAS